MNPALDDWNWEEVFKYATPHRCEADHRHGPNATIVTDDSIATSKFTRDDVTYIFGMLNGYRESPPWVGVFELADGRIAAIRAGCDYTGWG